jgi:hypothetical protein
MPKVSKVWEEKKTAGRIKTGIMECWNAGEEQRQIAE